MSGSDRAVVTTTTLVVGKTTTGATTSYVRNLADIKTFQAAGRTTASTGSVTVNIEGTLGEPATDAVVHWDTVATLGPIALSTTDASSSVTSQDRFRYYRINVTAISGTGASVDVKVGM